MLQVESSAISSIECAAFQSKMSIGTNRNKKHPADLLEKGKSDYFSATPLLTQDQGKLSCLGE